MPRALRSLHWVLCFSLSLSCSSGSSPRSAGADLDEIFGRNGESCGRGMAVIMTDYVSTNVALIDLDGQTRSGSFISSASAETRLNAPLSGDVAFPSSRMTDITLLDRFPASVVSLIETGTAAVKGQMDLRTGFNANPQDYLQLSAQVALVSRYEENPRPGREPFDGGDDLLVVNPETLSIVDRVDLSSLRRGEQLARPGSLTRIDDSILVTLSGFDTSFSEAGDARVAMFDSQDFELQRVLEVPGMKNCGSVATSANGSRFALTCSGLIGAANGANPEFSGVVVFARTVGASVLAFEEETRFQASDLGLGPFAFSIAFASTDLLLAGMYGALEGEDRGRLDRIVSLNLESDEVDTVLTSSEGAFNLGDVRCVEACEVCFVADASRGLVQRIPVDEGVLGTPQGHPVEVDLPLPPRQLGWF